MIATRAQSVARRLREMVPARLGRAGADPWRRAGRATGPLPKARDGVVGIEIAPGGLRFVELKRVGAAVALRSHGEIAYGTSEDLESVLATLIDDWGVEARDVHVVNTTSRANLKIQTAPAMPDSDLDAIIQGEIESEAELLGEPLVGDWCPLVRGPDETQLLVGKVPVRDLEMMTTACEAAGFRLQVLTSSSVILAAHIVATGAVPEGETVGLLDIGRSKMNMALITHEQVRLVREVYQGLSAKFLRNVAQVKGDVDSDLDLIGEGLDEIVATMEQVQRTWHQYQEHNPGTHMHHLVMTGETTRISRLLGLLQNDLKVPVVSYNPTESVRVIGLPDDFEKMAATYAVPWVLATTPPSEIPLNFTDGVPDLRAARTVQVIAGAAVMGMLATGVLQFTEGSRLAGVEETLTAVESEKAELQVELGLLEEVRVAWERWLTEQMALGGVPAPDVRPYLAELIRAKPPDVFLTRLSFGRGGSFCQLEAEAVAVAPTPTASHKAMERFIHQLGTSPLVEHISMSPLTYERKKGVSDDLEFSLVAQVRALDSGEGAAGEIVIPRREDLP